MLIIITALVVIAVRGTLLWRRRHARSWSWWAGLGLVLAAAIMPVVAARSDLEGRSLLVALAMPAGLAWIGLIIASVVVWARSDWRAGVTMVLLTVLYTVAGNTWMGTVLMAKLEAPFPPMATSDITPVQAVLVLGGGSDVDGAGFAQAGSSGDRVVMAAALWHAGKTPVLIGSGVATAIDGPDRSLAQETATLWRGLGVPASAIRCIPINGTVGPTNTGEELAWFAELVRQEGWTRVGVLSSAWHLPRVMALAKRQQLEAIANPIACDRRGRFPGWSPVHVVPNGRGFQLVHWAGKEWMAKIMGWH